MTSLQIDPERCVSCCFIPGASHLVDAIPVLEKMFDTMRRDELVLHLSFKTAALELDVLPTLVSQLIDPDVAVIIGAPRPRLLAGKLAMIRDMDHTPIRLLVIDPEIVSLGITCKQREEIRHLTKPPYINTLFDRKLEDRP